MVILLAVCAVSMQQLRVEAMVDRHEVRLGEEVVLTITVEATGNDPVQILNPPLVGLELRGSSDRSEVSIRDGVATRVFRRDLRLRAAQAGRATIGAARARVGSAEAGTDPIELTVTAAARTTAEFLSPTVREMIRSSAPPQPSEDLVFVEVLVSKDSVMLGEQIDLAVVAWFPRQIRTTLRNPPMLQPPQLQGAWTYARAGGGAIDLERRVGSVAYNLYVLHQVVFPLMPGRLGIGPATVSYSVPLTYSFLSREVRHEPQSDSVHVEVAAQPAAGRPARFDGAAAAALELALDAAPRQISVGEGAIVTATLTGRGNVSLWPEPRLEWPEAVRVYPEAVEVEISPDAERLSGSKTFRYLVVPDSSGPHRIGEIRYEYFDIEAREYRALRSPPLDLVAETDAALGRPRSPRTYPLIASSPGSRIERLANSMTVRGWLLVLLLPPVAAVACRMRPWARRKRKASTCGHDRPLEALEGELRRTLRGLVGDAGLKDAEDLAGALRAAGVEGPVAVHAARVRNRLWQAKYGPESEVDPQELAAEVQEVLRALVGEPGDSGRATAVSAILLMVAAAAMQPAEAQTAERLYEAGVLRAAADSFAARARQEPWIAAHWYNMGAALHAAGELPEARRAWLFAARIAPRDRRLRDAFRSVPASDGLTERLVWVSHVSPAEATLAAASIWLVAWLLAGARARVWVVASAIVLAAAAAGYGGYVARRYATPIAFVLDPETRLRVAPYGPAPERRLLDEGVAVVVERVEGPWALVKRGGDVGWVLREEIISLQ